MLSVEQSYSRLFRPWDVCERSKTTDLKTETNCGKITTELNIETKTNKRKIDENKRENRLRKIRGKFQKSEINVHQDATVSTTTEDGEDVKIPNVNKVTNKCSDSVVESPVASLSLCCDRLLQEPVEMKPEKTERKPKDCSIKSPSTIGNLYSPVIDPKDLMPCPTLYNTHPGFVSEYFPSADIAQALGVPPTDPLLLESLAQGYAMELEYARILHQENEAKILNSRKQRPKKYKCPHCQVGFSNNGQLKGHIRIHTGERPYKCDEKNCGKTFTRNEELTRHKRIHSGVRPYPCSTCGKKFGRRDHLKKHTRTHFLQAERMMPVFVPLTAVPHVGGFPYLYGY